MEDGRSGLRVLGGVVAALVDEVRLEGMIQGRIRRSGAAHDGASVENHPVARVDLAGHPVGHAAALPGRIDDDELGMDGQDADGGSVHQRPILATWRRWSARWLPLSWAEPAPTGIAMGLVHCASMAGPSVQGTGARPMIDGVFINRNAGEGFDFVNLSVRVSRAVNLGERVRIEVLAEAFNALNRTNGLTKNGVFGAGVYPIAPSATFGQTTAVQDPRTMQLGVRIGF